MAEESDRLPCRSLMEGKRAARETAEGEVGLRVTARMVKGG